MASQKKQTDSVTVRLRVMMATKKIRIDRRAITEVLVADTDSESDAEASNDEEFYEFEDQQRELTAGCVDAVFYRNFSAAGGTDKLILPATPG